MCIGGKGVAQGYFKNPELTKQCFIQNPFDETKRLYRTGDLCRYGSSGTIEFLGRKDDQVKIRGYRIELGEIRERIRQIPEIKDAVVKIEGLEKSSGAKDKVKNLAEELEKMGGEDANKVLKAVENLSDHEIAFMLKSAASA